jgi:hypothetical protein
VPVESDEDRAAFFADFGVSALYEAAAGGSAALTGIFDAPYRSVGVNDVESADARPTFLCRSSDLPAGAEGGDVGDTLTIGAVTYRVIAHEPDGTGMTLLILGRN